MAIRDWLAAFSNDVVEVKEPVATDLEATGSSSVTRGNPCTSGTCRGARRSETSGPHETASRRRFAFRTQISSRS